MKSRFIAYFTLLTLFIPLPLIPVNAAVKVGVSCKTLGITYVASGKTYTCVKSGKKLVWKLKPKGANPSPRSSTIASIETRYWSSPSHYELVNVNADLTRVFIIFEEKELRYQLTKWGMDSRLFVYAIAGGEQLLTVEPLKDVFQYAVNGKLLLSLWKKNVLDGALLKIAVGPLFMDKTIEFGSLIEAGALKPSLVPEKNWLLETRVDTSKITRTLGANPLPTQTPVPTPTPSATPTPVSTPQNFGRAPYFEVGYSAGSFTVSIKGGEIQLFASNGFAPIALKARVIDSSGRSTISSTLSIYPPYLTGKQFVFQGFTSGDIHQISIAAVFADRTDNWSMPVLYSIVSRQSIVQKNQSPIGGQYLLGDIGPGGGRIFLTPDSKNTLIFADNLVKAKTPTGYFYEVFYPNWIGFAFRCHASEYDEARLNSFIKIIDQFTDNDGQKNTQVMLNSGQCQQNSMINHTKQFNEGSFLGPNGRKVNLGGLNDWFIPSLNELQPLGVMSPSIIFENKQFGMSLWETMLGGLECAISSVNSDGYQLGLNFKGGIIRPISGGTGILSKNLCLVRKFR